RLSASDKLPDSQPLLQRGQQLLDAFAAGSLAVDADQRLRSREAHQHPAAVLQVELESVVAAGAYHRLAGHLLRQLALQPAVELGTPPRVLLPLEVNVVAGVEVRADQLLQALEDARERQSVLDDHVGEGEAGKHSVPPRGVA